MGIGIKDLLEGEMRDTGLVCGTEGRTSSATSIGPGMLICAIYDANSLAP